MCSGQNSQSVLLFGLTCIPLGHVELVAEVDGERKRKVEIVKKRVCVDFLVTILVDG